MLPSPPIQSGQRWRQRKKPATRPSASITTAANLANTIWNRVEARQKRRELMGQALAVLINGRDSGLVEAPCCSQCGSRMHFHEYRSKTIRGLEGETTLERAYYVCPQGCGETFFPPGPETETAE